MNAATDRYEPPNALFNTRFQNAATSWNSFLKRKIIFFFSLSKIGAATADEWLQVQTYFTYFYHLTLVNLFLFKLTFRYHYLFTTFVSSLPRVQSVLRLYINTVFIFQQDIETFDLEAFKYNFVNITAFRAVDSEYFRVMQTLKEMERVQLPGYNHSVINRTRILQVSLWTDIWKNI